MEATTKYLCDERVLPKSGLFMADVTNKKAGKSYGLKKIKGKPN